MTITPELQLGSRRTQQAFLWIPKFIDGKPKMGWCKWQQILMRNYLNSPSDYPAKYDDVWIDHKWL